MELQVLTNLMHTKKNEKTIINAWHFKDVQYSFTDSKDIFK